MPMPQRMLGKEEAAFWHGLGLEMGEELELRVLPPDIQLEDVGQRVQWGPEPEPVQEGPPLLPLGEELMEVENSAEQVQRDGSVVKDDAAVE